MSSPIVEARHLVKTYPRLRAVDDVSFSIAAGQCFGLLGPNGAGKSTTVEIMEGILPADSGEVLFNGEPIGAAFRQSAGIQFQTTALQDFITTREALVLFQSFYARSRSLDELIELCALQEFLQRDVRKLSGGQRQRLLLAIALVNDPQVVFLDEPTTGLDPQARRNFWDLVERIKAENKTVLLTTHYMEEAYQLCDDIAIMDHGKIIARGTPAELLQHHFGHVVLDLPRADVAAQLERLTVPTAVVKQRVEILTADVNASIDELRHLGVSLTGLRIRERSLEDLFLELTGKDLRT